MAADGPAPPRSTFINSVPMSPVPTRRLCPTHLASQVNMADTEPSGSISARMVLPARRGANGPRAPDRMI